MKSTLIISVQKKAHELRLGLHVELHETNVYAVDVLFLQFESSCFHGFYHVIQMIGLKSIG